MDVSRQGVYANAVLRTGRSSDTAYDPVAYYDGNVFGRPDTGFAMADSTQETASHRPLGFGAEYLEVVSVNAAGTSGEELIP